MSKRRILGHMENVDIWKEAHMYPMAEFLREERLRWFGHVHRRDKDDATRTILQKEESSQTKAEVARPGERENGRRQIISWFEIELIRLSEPCHNFFGQIECPNMVIWQASQICYGVCVDFYWNYIVNQIIFGVAFIDTESESVKYSSSESESGNGYCEPPSFSHLEFYHGMPRGACQIGEFRITTCNIGMSLFWHVPERNRQISCEGGLCGLSIIQRIPCLLLSKVYLEWQSC